MYASVSYVCECLSTFSSLDVFGMSVCSVGCTKGVARDCGVVSNCWKQLFGPKFFSKGQLLITHALVVSNSGGTKAAFRRDSAFS